MKRINSLGEGKTPVHDLLRESTRPSFRWNAEAGTQSTDENPSFLETDSILFTRVRGLEGAQMLAFVVVRMFTFTSPSGSPIPRVVVQNHA